MRCCGSSRSTRNWLLVAGPVLVFLGTGAFFLIPAVVNVVIRQVVPLSSSSFTFRLWQDVPMPIYIRFHVLSVANALELQSDPRARPFLVDAGPYTYRMHKPRLGVAFFEHNASLSYHQRIEYTAFVPEQSAGDPTSDLVTCVNLPLLVVAGMLEYAHPNGWERFIVDELFAITGETLFVQRTAAEMLWGYEEPTLKLAKQAAERFFNRTFNFDDIFGLMHFKMSNYSTDGEYNVYSGAYESELLGSIHTWRGRESLSWWASDYANMINSTDGTIYFPGVRRDSRIYAFQSFLLRAHPFDWLADKRHFGVPVYHFGVTERALGDPRDYPENRGFCMPDGTLADCHDSGGVLNAASANFGAPLYMSWPHFFLADRRYLEAVLGLHDPSEDFRTMVDIEPLYMYDIKLTGCVMNISFCGQVNVKMRPLSLLPSTRFLPQNGTILPIFWLCESAEADRPFADFLMRVLVVPHLLVTRAAPALLSCVGALLLLVGMYHTYRLRSRRAPPELDEARGEREPLVPHPP